MRFSFCPGFFRIEYSTFISMEALVTVLMPNYNNEAYLNEAIDSILSQSLTDFIFLIVDDGSTDRSVEIIQSYSDPRIQLICKEKNSGIVDTLNLGLAHIHTRYFVRMDGDDTCHPQRLRILLDYMETHPETGVCGSHIQLFGSSTEIWKQELDTNKIKARMVYSNGVTHGPSIFRTDVLKNNGINYRNRHPYMEDYDLFIRLKHITEFAHVDAVLYNYRLLYHNSTVKNRSSLLERYLNIYKDVLKELELDTNDEHLAAHAGLFGRTLPVLPFKTYKNWQNTLIQQNRKLKIYPQEALEAVLDEAWQKLFFKISPVSFGKSARYFISSKKIGRTQFLFLIKSKINRLLGRR